MQEIEIHGLEEIDRIMQEIIEEAPDRMREFHEAVGKAALEEVRAALGSSKKVSGWQQMHVGSGGGYAAVRPDSGMTEENSEGISYAHGHITNALENGHRTRSPSGRNARYYPRLKMARVPGKFFYKRAGETVKGKILDIAFDFVWYIDSKFDE